MSFEEFATPSILHQAFNTCSSVYFKNRKYYFKVSKNSEKNSDVNNGMIYQGVKFELEIPYIQGCTKMIKSDRF
jgi:hypothetical protein